MKEWADGTEDGALRIRNLCLMEVCRETGTDEAAGGGGKGPVGGGYRGPGGGGGVDTIRESLADGSLPLLIVLRCERSFFSSGRGGKLEDGGGLGDARDNLRPR